MPTKYLIESRTLVGTLSEALAQQLWLTTWVDIHSDIVRPGWGVQVKATIPEQVFVEDDPPRGGGLVARAEVDFQIVVESDSGQVLTDAYTELATQMTSVAVDIFFDEQNLSPTGG